MPAVFSAALHLYGHRTNESIWLLFESTEVVQGLLLIAWQQPTQLHQKPILRVYILVG
jgi:hypothetical protein